ncbi:diacylglycerol kinase [Ottowia sp. GY511]|uniref:Diacylglycerol/lipid kinase family protein n=1 Tax=Ottowia flava TaxID=2675430 RepID=A0ABW4KMK8_9BURK|nr:diacylglycerol kinase family protein [Ottowia sp. GY511]TXK29589.1 diacylglycerol kinase [Ottowia sp. GY511]
MALPSPPLFIVFNASSGGADAEQASGRVGDLLTAAGRPHEIIRVRGDEELTRATVRASHAAREAHGAVVAAGGDGTLNAVAQVVWNADQVMGVLPQGTFNYFGRTHGMPTALDDSVAALLSAREQAVTVGLLGERVFLVNASVGLYPRLLEERESAKRRFGRRRVVALLSGLGTILRGGSVLTLELSVEGQTRVVRTRTLFVGNNELQLQEIGLRHAVDVEQGRLAAITLQPVSTLRTLWLLIRGALGRLDGAEGVDSFAFDQLVVRMRRRVRWVKVALDGEVLRMPPPLVFRTAPRPLRLLLPAAEAEEGSA